MSFWDSVKGVFSSKPQPQPQPVEEEIPVVIELTGFEDEKGGRNLPIQKIPLLKPAGLVYTRNQASPVRRGSLSTATYDPPEYDLNSLAKLEDLESYVRRAYRAKEGLMFKEGWAVVGADPDRVKYINTRLKQIERATGTPFSLLLRSTAANLIRSSNAFWVKVRNIEASGGKERVSPSGKSIKPIAGYFSLPPETMNIARDPNGKVRGYRQRLNSGLYLDFNPEDVVHFFVDRKEGFAFGTPITVPVESDIQALRKIEENLELLVYQHLFPLIQYQVGTEDNPGRSIYPEGRSEIEVVQYEMRTMPSEGMIVTPGHHQIKAIGLEGRALRIEGYLNHFKARVLAGLGVSSVDVGEGGTSSRSTADTMSRNLVDDVKSYQDTLEIFIHDLVVKELLEESTFDPSTLFDDENLVRVVFKEIDLENRMKVENHALESFNNNALTFSELRREFGREPFTPEDEEWEDTHWKLFQEPLALIQAVDEPYSAQAQAVAASSSTAITPQQTEKATSTTRQIAKERIRAKATVSKKIAGPKRTSAGKKSKSVSNKNRPRNQYGRRTSAKTRRDFLDSLQSLYLQARDVASTEDRGLINASIQLVFAEMEKELELSISSSYREGLSSVGQFGFPSRFTLTARQELDRRRFAVIQHLKDDLVDRIYRSERTKQVIEAAFDSLEYRLDFIQATELAYARNLGRLVGLKNLQITHLFVSKKEDTDCETCKAGLRIPNNRDILEMNQIPPFHPNCTCQIEAE